MADEKTFALTHTVISDSGGTINTGALEVTDDQTSGGDVASGTQDVGTSAEALDVPGDIGTPLDLTIVNLDETNYVEVFRDSGSAYLISKLKPGRFCHVAALDTVPYVKFNTAAGKIAWWANDD